MKKTLIPTLFILLALPQVWAADIYYEILQEKSVSQIQTELQAVINNANDHDKIIVTGSKTNANATLALNIIMFKIVVWKAVYQSVTPFGANHLISFSGDGVFEVANGTLITANANALYASNEGSIVMVSGSGKLQTSGNGASAIITYGHVFIKDNAQLSGTTGEVISSLGDHKTVTVTGGTITATSENAILAKGSHPRVDIAGGYLSNNATGLFPVILAYDPSYNSDAIVLVRGDAKIEAKGDGCAIISIGSVYIEGDAEVSNNNGGNEVTATIKGYSEVEVRDKAVVTARNNYAILSYRDVLVDSHAKVVAKENAIGIYIYGEGAGKAEIKNQAQVIAENNYAISYFKPNVTIIINGGSVFAYGKEVSDVVNHPNFTGPTNSGVVLAWDKAAGNTNYAMNSTDDIFVTPASATAHWDKQGTQFGISYAKDDNTGFIPLDVNLLSVKETGASNIKVYPNPTTGELRIENGGLKIENFEIFDVTGKSHVSSVTCHQNNGIETDISHLPAGAYFLRVNNEMVKIVKQ
jgi:hypothetical protein